VKLKALQSNSTREAKLLLKASEICHLKENRNFYAVGTQEEGYGRARETAQTKHTTRKQEETWEPEVRRRELYHTGEHTDATSLATIAGHWGDENPYSKPQGRRSDAQEIEEMMRI